MSVYIQDLTTPFTNSMTLVGGKAANLIELSQIQDIHVPEGFCVTTEAFKKITENNQAYLALIQELNHIKASDKESIKALSQKIRLQLEFIELPLDLTHAITESFKAFDANTAFAIRSSATAEDLPNASFAGQYDTYLNRMGLEEIMQCIKKCWASLYSERAINYRMLNGFEHDKVTLAVIVQKMLSADTSGVMFTADPNNSNRKVLTLDATYGLGEALVSGLVSSDNYRVKHGNIISKSIAKKVLASMPLQHGGTTEVEVAPHLKETQALTDEQILRLERIGRRIEAHFGAPQDIEWSYVDDRLYILQSRPITTLYPLPIVNNNELRVFISSGHMQMMTAAMKPLGHYFFNSVLGNQPSQVIGGRLYTDVTHDFASPLGRIMSKSIIGMIGDDLITQAVKKVIRDKELIKKLPKGKDKVFKAENDGGALSVIINAVRIYKENNPEIITGFIAKEDKSIKQMEKELAELSGDAVFEFIYQDHEGRRKKITQPPNAGAITAALLSTMWFNKKIKRWLGIENAADSIIQSIPNSITADTGLALLDVADVVRKYPEVMDYFTHANDVTFFEDIEKLNGGQEVCKSIKDYLTHYGMRCSGDIDITVPRWSEEPTALVPLILNNIKNFEPNSRQIKYEQGIRESQERIDELTALLQKKPNGRRKAKKIKKVASVIRNYIGYREYPKFSYIRRYYIYKQALLREASKLLKEGLIKDLTDIYYLSFDELRDVVKTRQLDYSLILKRKEEYAFYEKLTPQRVITSDGDVIEASYDKSDFPSGALVGIPVSAGIVEGRARVISSMDETDFEEGDILVTTFTDPSWTPVFVSIKGLVTEIGGLITHGSIIAREYGLPAVVSVENATKLIKDGQRIRLNGTKGYIELLPE